MARGNVTLASRAFATRIILDGRRAVGVEYVAARRNLSRAARARSDPVGRRLQHAAASDAVGHRPGRSSARDGDSTRRRSAGRGRKSAGSSGGDGAVFPQRAGAVPGADAGRPRGNRGGARISLRHRPGGDLAGRRHRLFTHARRPRRARHPVLLARHGGRGGFVVPLLARALRRRVQHDARAAPSRGARAALSALDRPARESADRP